MTRRRPWYRRYFWLIVLAVLAVAAILTWLVRGETEPEARPLLATAEIGDIEDAVTAAGSLQPSESVEVGAQVTGQLEKLHVEVGDVVTAGTLVAEIDATVQRNRVDASRASLKAQEAQLAAREAALKLAKANAQRQIRLVEDDATTAADFDSAMNTLAAAESSLIQLQSQINQSKAGLALDEAQLGFTRIYAPMDGTVVAIDKQVGQTLNAAQQTPVIMRIADMSTMTVEAAVSEADIVKLKPGMEVYFTTLGGGDRRWYGELRQILPTPVVDQNVVLYTALFDVDNSDGALLSAMTAQIFFVTASARNVLKVPVAALSFQRREANSAPGAAAAAMGGAMGPGPGGRSRDPDRAARPGSGRGMGGRNVGASRATVRRVADDGSIEIREVRVGVMSRISAEILEGLAAGDQVVAGVLQPRDTNDGPRAGPGRR